MLIKEVMAADTIVIGLPIYNFGVPAALKAWIDQIVRAGV
jgi:FMN-dependent NADH-azoreductase